MDSIHYSDLMLLKKIFPKLIGVRMSHNSPFINVLIFPKITVSGLNKVGA